MLLGTLNLFLNVNINLLLRAVNYALGTDRLAFRVPTKLRASHNFLHTFFLYAQPTSLYHRSLLTVYKRQ